MSDPLIGRQIGDYKIVSQLGEGGMGMVYKGQHAALGQIVAVKSLHPTLVNNQSARDRFIREAEALARLNHPNIISLLNFINNESGCFIVMEYAEGEDIEHKLQRQGLIPPEQCLPWFVEACRGLSFAHKMQIIHRDIKPSNIMIHPSGRAKLLDFGTAKLVDAKRLTQQGMTLGTIIYMSKEQLLGKPLDARSDLYSLGVTLYECVTGQLPFYDDEEKKLVIKIAKTEPIPPSQHYPGISKELEALVLKSMAKEPEQRFQSADEMERALMALLGPSAAAAGLGASSVAGPRPVDSAAAVAAPVAPAPVAPAARPPAAVAPAGGGAALFLSPLFLAGAVLGILGVGVGVPIALLGGSTTLKVLGLVVLLVFGLIGALLVALAFLQRPAGGAPVAPALGATPTAPVGPTASSGGAKCPTCGRALLAGMAACPFCNPGAPPPAPVATGGAPTPVPQPMTFAPGGTLNINTAQAAQQYAPAAGGGAAAPPGGALLQIIDGADKGKQYPLTRAAPFTIGRAPTCGATLNDPGVSGTHAQVAFEGPQLVVQDMGSRNGVFVNNQKVQRQPVKTGDLIVIGSTRLLVTLG